MYIRLELPLPPSVNGLYATITKDRAGRKLKFPRRAKSEKYQNWIQLANIKLKEQETYKIEGWEWLDVKLWLYTPIYNKDGSKKKKDLDNYLKALFDFLWDHIEWFEDKNIKTLQAEKFESDEEKVIIFIREIDG